MYDYSGNIIRSGVESTVSETVFDCNLAEYVASYDGRGISTTGVSAYSIKEIAGRTVYLFKLHGTGVKAFHLGKTISVVYNLTASVFFYTDNSMTNEKCLKDYTQSFSQLGNTSNGATYFTIPEGAEYAAFSVLDSCKWSDYIDSDGTPMLMVSERRYPYEPSKREKIIESCLPNKLKHKTIYWFGDSIIAGLYCDSPISKKIDAKYGTVSRNHAISNTTFFNGQIANQIQNSFAEEPDAVIFDGGANDTNQYRFDSGLSCWNTSSGSIADESPSLTYNYGTDTVCGAFESFIQAIRNKYPTTKIIFVATHFIGANHPYADQKGCFDAFYTACKKWCVSIVDIHNSGNINSYLDRSFTSNGTAPDTTHPTDATHEKYYIPMIVAKLREIFPD